MPHPVTICPGSQKIAMNRAWRLAREGQRIYGGSVRQFRIAFRNRGRVWGGMYL